MTSTRGLWSMILPSPSTTCRWKRRLPRPAPNRCRSFGRGEPFTLPAAGLGTEQGRVAVKIGAMILECPVTAWTEAGLAATLPVMAVAGPAKADLLVALADGTLVAAVPVELLPAQGAAVAAAD